MGLRQTSFSDVCGTVDELERRLQQAGELAEPLLADAEFMIARMRRRLEEYRRFQEEVRAVLVELDNAAEVDGVPAEKAAGFIRRRLGAKRPLRGSDVQKLCAAGEEVRAVAQALENRLRACKDLALRLGREFAAVRGNRPWLPAEAEGRSVTQELASRYQAWLPPEPHGRKLLECLGASRAHVLDQRLPDGQPVVQFQDGGAMPMSLVRWDEDVKNFRPAGFGREAN